jgi:asparaginyl-tRNA synthetase
MTSCYQILPPLITSSDCEGAGQVFTITPQSQGQPPGTPAAVAANQPKLYFREPKYLTVSSQLHLEAHAAEQGEVWALTPVFRAEESDTPRHLSEFYMLEVEARQVSLEALTDSVQQLVGYLVQKTQASSTGAEILKYYANEKYKSTGMEFVDIKRRWEALQRPWRQITYSEAIDVLKDAYDSSAGKLFVQKPQWGHSLQLEHERWLADEHFHHTPVFVTHYPKAIKPFYMLPSERSPDGAPGDTVACFDLLFPFGYAEIAGGSLREHRLEPLIQAMRETGLLRSQNEDIDDGQPKANGEGYPFLQPGESLGNLEWYADLRRFGSSPHGGYGLGFDRLVAYLTGASNVREVVPFPRTWGKAEC